MTDKVKDLQEELFQTKEKIPQKISSFDLDKFHAFLMKKYNIQRFELIDLWKNTATGVSRAEYADRTGISEDTIKSQMSKLYIKLRKKSNNPNILRYNKANAIIEYYQSLRLYEAFMHNQ